jgi:hypothetical protein
MAGTGVRLPNTARNTSSIAPSLWLASKETRTGLERTQVVGRRAGDRRLFGDKITHAVNSTPSCQLGWLPLKY